MLGREGLPHEHVQFGVGTVRPIIGASLGYDLGGPLALGIDAWFQATIAVAQNAIGYEPGQRLLWGARLSSTLGVRAFRVGIGGEATTESAETWSGVVGTDGNLGRTDVVALATARWSPFASWGFFGAVRVPIYVHTVEAQLSYPAQVQLGIATAFDLGGHGR